MWGESSDDINMNHTRLCVYVCVVCVCVCVCVDAVAAIGSKKKSTTQTSGVGKQIIIIIPNLEQLETKHVVQFRLQDAHLV